MEFETTREQLLPALQQLNGISERTQTLQILNHILMDLQSGQLKLTASNLEVEATWSIPLDSSETTTGQITVPAQKCLAIFNSLPDNAAVKAVMEGENLMLNTPFGSFKLATLPAADFPFIDHDADINAVELPSNVLWRLIDKTHFAMAKQDVRYYLNGVLLSLKDNLLTAEATDAHRLSYASATLEQTTGAFDLLIPRRTVTSLLSLLKKDDESPVRLAYAKNHIVISNDTFRLTSQLIDSPIPDYSPIIPHSNQYCVTVDGALFKNALARIGILADEKKRIVKIQFERNSLSLGATNANQEKATGDLPVDYDGPEMTIYFNLNYLLEVIAHVDADVINLHLNSAESSVLIMGQGEEDNKHIIMPLTP